MDGELAELRAENARLREYGAEDVESNRALRAENGQLQEALASATALKPTVVGVDAEVLAENCVLRGLVANLTADNRRLQDDLDSLRPGRYPIG